MSDLPTLYAEQTVDPVTGDVGYRMSMEPSAGFVAYVPASNLAAVLDEIERLRALLAEAQDQIGGSYCGNCDRFTDCSPSERELSARIAAAIGKPDATDT